MEESVSKSRKSQKHSNPCLLSVWCLHVHPLTLSVPFAQGTLKEHFKKCDSGFDHIFESLKQSFLAFGKKKTDTYEVRNR